MITMISLVTMCHHRKIAHHCWLYSPHYISHPWLIYFAAQSLYLLISLTFFFPPHSLLSTGNHLFVLCIYDCFCFVMFAHLFYFWITYINEIVQHLSLSEVISLSIIPSRAFRVVSNWQGYIYVIYHCSSAGKESACNAGDLDSIPGSGRSPGKGIGYPLQYSWASLVAQTVKNLPAMQEIWVQSLG